MDNSELCSFSRRVGAADSQAHGVASRHRRAAPGSALKRSTTPFAPTSISPAIRPWRGPSCRNRYCGWRLSHSRHPVAYKDIYNVAGMPTTAASKVMAGYLAEEDCTVAARLRRAGAICLGKLNTHEFASGSMEVFGTARNPWNTAMVPGGSSSGSGTALAAHLVTGATGSDTGDRCAIPPPTAVSWA